MAIGRVETAGSQVLSDATDRSPIPALSKAAELSRRSLETMSMRRLVTLLGVLAVCGNVASAQGLIWNLPEDGTWIRYEGTYTQLNRRPDSADGDLTLQWRRNLTIKSVGAEEAEFEGVMQPCRWIELKVETGKTTEGVLDAGPGGIRMYKLLVPVSAIQGTVYQPFGEGRERYVSFIPIVKGYRRIGDEPAQPIESGVFQLYPVISLMQHYRTLENGGQQPVTSAAGNFDGWTYKARSTMETSSTRSTSTCDVSRSEAIPFGVVKWTAKITIEIKGTTDPRTEFKESVILTEDMQAVSIGTDAESEFLIN